jgi:hypothetical protein
MLMSGRDIVSVVRTYHNSDKSVLVLGTSIDSTNFPPTDKYERADMIIIGWLLTPIDEMVINFITIIIF